MSLYRFPSGIFIALLARAVAGKLAALQVAEVPPYNAPWERSEGVEWRWWSSFDEPHVYLRLQIKVSDWVCVPVKILWEHAQAMEPSEENAMMWIRATLDAFEREVRRVSV